MKATQPARRTTWVLACALLAVPALATPAPAQAPPGMGMQHPGMAMPHGAMPGAMADGMKGRDGHGRMGDHGGRKGHRMGPHNAAQHFLGMADALGLDEGQETRLRKMRDDWIEANSTNEARLKAAESDLGELLSADRIDMKRVDEELGIVGKIEGQLWHAFARQLAAIKEMLTDDQRARLRDRHRRMGSGDDD